MTPSEILHKAKALIDTPEKWCQGNWAVDKNGQYVFPPSIDACKFCSVGVFIRTGVLDINYVAYLQKTMNGKIELFNDTHTHAEVMQKWDEAIALAEADEQGGV